MNVCHCCTDGISETEAKSLKVLQSLNVVQLLSCVRLFVTSMDCSTPGFLGFHYLPEFARMHVH